MRVVAMLGFFDDEPDLVARAVSHACVAGATHLVAVDGPYDLFPSDRPYSREETIEAVVRAANAYDVPVSMWSKHVWGAGDEVQKRQFMLERVLESTRRGDWLLVLDADHLWYTREALGSHLEALPDHVRAAEVGFTDSTPGPYPPHWYEARLLLRAEPGMRYDRSHWLVRYPDGAAVSTLRAGAREWDAGVADLRDVASVYHAVHDRDEGRRSAQATYYERRDGGGVEKSQRSEYEERACES